MKPKTCGSCGILNPKLHICQLFGHQMNPAADFCSRYQKELQKCDICGNLTIDYAIDSETCSIICSQCLAKSGTCSFCSKNKECLFETSAINIPKFVQKQIRQGNMVTVATVKNPERIRQTCQTGCSCYDPEDECLRQNNYCSKYEDILNSKVS